jgi:hypothetical protein
MQERKGERFVASFSTFSPKILMTIGLGSLDKASRTRAIGIAMRRKPRNVTLEKFRHFDGSVLRKKCRRWVHDNSEALQQVGRIDLEECPSDRQQDVWEPLAAIARVVRMVGKPVCARRQKPFRVGPMPTVVKAFSTGFSLLWPIISTHIPGHMFRAKRWSNI